MDFLNESTDGAYTNSADTKWTLEMLRKENDPTSARIPRLFTERREHMEVPLGLDGS